MQVAVIGAGAAGLCAARHFAQSSRAVPCVFEQSGCIGGTWVYTDQTGYDTRGEPIHSSMYKNLKTNLPKEVMAFPDFPFRESGDSFVHHSKVLDYLQDYSNHFGLEKFIKLNTKIESVRPSQGGDRYWEVVYRCLNTNSTTNAFFDGVLVCNGHYSKPLYPAIPGQEKFVGTMIHSHDYRDSGHFKGENVVILGAAASGTDIAVEISKDVNQVYLAHNGPFLSSKLPANVAQIRGISECIGPNSFSLKDGSRVQCDSVILATGYHYDFPFLSDECDIFVEKNQVQPLYKHFLNIEHNSMALIGMPLQICPFPLFDNQIRYFMKILLGDVKIPSKAEMYVDTAEEKEYRINTLGMREKDFHKMGDLQWEYNKEISNLAEIDPLPPVIEKLYKEVWGRRRKDLTRYKQDAFSVQDLHTFTEQGRADEQKQRTI